MQFSKKNRPDGSKKSTKKSDEKVSVQVSTKTAPKSEPKTGWRKILAWLDHYLLAIWSGFLLAFIPLYPKIPLFSPIEQYIVRVRLEDLFIFVAFLIWGIYWLRGKVAWRKPIVYIMLAYIGVGLLSVLSALFITQTVPLQPLHIGKTVLHYFRYIQYFSLFFIVFTAIKTKQQVKAILATIVLTVIALSIYGYGQQNYYWPVYSTMNREFSKGVRLYLTEHARVQSTFAGHYDLGAYLVIILPLLLALGYGVKSWKLKLAIHGSHFLGMWLLIVSASRTSFGAYIVAITIVTLLYALNKKTILGKVWWATSRYLALGLIIVYTFFTFGGDIYDRLLQVLQSYPEAHRVYHDLNRERKMAFDRFVLVPLGIKEITIPKAEIPENAISTEEAQRIIVSSDTRPSTTKPSDVYVDVPDLIEVSTTSADGTVTTSIEERDRTYSDNAIRYGLSLAIRLDTLWPQAIDGFKENPVLGKGYATLNKQAVNQFTEADSTDNNFLRTLGETGLLGFVTFYGAIALALAYAVKSVRTKDSLLQALAIGYIAGTIGLLGNAVYIDVFAASKVAQVFWGMTGMFIAYYYLVQSEKSAEPEKAKKTDEPEKKQLKSKS